MDYWIVGLLGGRPKRLIQQSIYPRIQQSICPVCGTCGLIPSTREFMHKQPPKKYRPFPPVSLPDRQWPNRVLTHAPIWCSVDLLDGNQALAVPMNVGQKLELFQTLVKCGFKEIEVGFPSASNTEFAFNRRLIEEKRVPDDVWLQVLVQARVFP